MSKLIIDNKIISSNLIAILTLLRKETGYFDTIEDKGEYISCTCPFHNNGHEQHPSFSVYSQENNNDVAYGTYHCFTCGESGPLYKLVAYCYNTDYETAKKWLVDNFQCGFIEENLFEEDINLSKIHNDFIDEKILDNYNKKHPYMYKRKLTDEVIEKFKVGYNEATQSITFPIWDENDNLVMITERSVNSKFFHIEANKDKPVYLLNFIKHENINSVIVCESQINALTCWSWGYPAIALLGTGSKSQYDILKKSGIRHYVVCLDGDDAGKKGTARFIENMKNSKAFIDYKIMLEGKDINDLTKEEFDNLEVCNV